ncbi:hypothetical protein Leryth_016260 [Lithospermum erythrorhizon]|nr:hypothetical protein Leryth_016260 [Lithospermum erythrorhizon]
MRDLFGVITQAWEVNSLKEKLILVEAELVQCKTDKYYLVVENKNLKQLLNKRNDANKLTLGLFNNTAGSIRIPKTFKISTSDLD